MARNSWRIPTDEIKEPTETKSKKWHKMPLFSTFFGVSFADWVKDFIFVNVTSKLVVMPVRQFPWKIWD
jgi:hypothetical protein